MKRAFVALLLPAAPLVLAQEDDAVVVTATRGPQPALEIPASVDRVFGPEIREARPQVNLSESLGRVPGIVVQNRSNYAQDLQVSSRGFGARAQFGVRGIRLIADGIPATMPDGQGQPATFSLGSAQSIEVLRGPFSALYGNAAGGVIVVETEDAPPDPTLEASFLAGSYDTLRLGLRGGAAGERVGGLAEASHFETGGYRDHSSAVRRQLNGKVKVDAGEGTAIAVVLNAFRQPTAQDPGGLTRAEFERNPRQAAPAAFAFDTRKSVEQDQAGATLEHRLDGGARLQASLYAGQRDLEQFLGFDGAAITASGGVVRLDRVYNGGALRYAAGETVRFSAGVEVERMEERRRGYVNNNGVAGALRRDEDDTVDSTDLYAQSEWKAAERWALHGGLRYSKVRFRARDRFVVPGNPDDSGAADYSALTPAAGVLFRASPRTSAYASVARGFETPTFAELAYSNAGTGLNFGLQPAKSWHYEAGLKTVQPRRYRLSSALFLVRTRDEIVVDQQIAPGRNTFKNAGRTDRQGVEVAAETLGGPLTAALSYTHLSARYAQAFTSGGATIPEGNLLPGVPRNQAFAALRYRQPGWYALVEGLYRGRVPVNDANAQFAGSYKVINLAAGLTQRGKGWRVSEFARMDNVADRHYAGSVIVNAAGSRFYEPAPGRSFSVGLEAAVEF